MAIPVLAISNRAEDIALGERLAKDNNLPFHSTLARDRMRSLLMDFPQSLILWDADHAKALDETNPTSIKSINVILKELSKPQKIFAITDKPLNENKLLSEIGHFGHHVFRRFESPAPGILSRLLAASLIGYPFGIQRFVSEATKPRVITLKDSAQRPAVVQAVQNVFEKTGVPERLAAQIAQASDELLLNSIYSAPPERPLTDTNLVFPADKPIELTIANDEEYSVLCVADSYGTLKKEVVLSFIRQNFKNTSFEVEGPRKSGLGLNGVIQSGISLLFISRPKVRTEVFLFFPRVKNYKDFRKGFRFLSLLSD